MGGDEDDFASHIILHNEGDNTLQIMKIYPLTEEFRINGVVSDKLTKSLSNVPTNKMNKYRYI